MDIIGKNAKRASMMGNTINEAKKNEVLSKLKGNLLDNKDIIFDANKLDLKNAKKSGLSPAMIDRLKVNEDYLNNIISGIQDIIDLEDPIDKVLSHKRLENGLELNQVVVPLGVVGIIYESRPNVTIDAFALNFKVGNACILKGGKEAIETNTIFEKIVRDTLIEEDLDSNMIQVIKDVTRESTLKLMKLDKYVDVLIPRGSQGLINTVLKESTIPVIETGAGNCHIFVDESADLEMALEIIENAKCQRVGVCNTVESLVVHKNIADAFIPKLIEYLPNVAFVGDELAVGINSIIKEASEEDFYAEYLEEKASIKVVDNIYDAIEHINEHHTSHSDAIITEDKHNADLFAKNIDSAAVYVNASTRFTDGFVFGLGAEIGISTQKLHARGPMGLSALTTYKYIITGKGQTR